MKKIFYILITLVLTIGISTSVLAARYGLDKAAAGAKYNTTSATGGNIYYYLQNIVSALLGLVAIIFFLLAAYAGIRWMSSYGNEEAKNKAKDTLTNSIIGLVIVVASYGITSFLFVYLVTPGDTDIYDTCTCREFWSADVNPSTVFSFSGTISDCEKLCKDKGEVWEMYAVGVSNP